MRPTLAVVVDLGSLAINTSGGTAKFAKNVGILAFLA
jgi:hypothetical protein